MAVLLEDMLPGVLYNGITSNKNVDFSGATSVALPAGTTIAGTTASGTSTITSTSANALTVGANGATNPVLKINANTASVATGITVVGAAAAGGVAVSVISSGTDESLTLDAKGTGTVTINGTATGAISLARATGVTGALTVTSASATSLTVGRLGATTPAFTVDSSTGTQVAGLKVTGAATAGTVAVVVTDSGSDASLTINAKGTGTIAIGTTSTGLISMGSTVSKKQVLASSGNTTMTSAMSGSVMLLDGATVDYALPAIGAGDIGMFFDFFVTVTSTDQTITAQTGDLLAGSIVWADTTTPLFDGFKPDVSDDLIFATNGTTTGGLIGSYYRFTAISATRWWVEGVTYGSGTAATPFS